MQRLGGQACDSRDKSECDSAVCSSLNTRLPFGLFRFFKHEQSSYFCRSPDNFCWGPAPVGPILVTGSSEERRAERLQVALSVLWQDLNATVDMRIPEQDAQLISNSTLGHQQISCFIIHGLFAFDIMVAMWSSHLKLALIPEYLVYSVYSPRR